MSVNIYQDQMQHAQMFGKPVLTTNQPIPRETVPDGWYCYDMRGTDSDPGAHAALVDHATFNHSGTVLSPAPLKQPNTAERRIGRKDYFLHGEEMDMETFCEEYDLKCPENPIKFEMRPASPDEAGIFYALPPEQDKELGAIGHIRIDFGSGTEFWHTWWPRGPESLNSSKFGTELNQVMAQLRRGVLKDLASMGQWCRSHGGEISGRSEQNYGYVVETERYRYCLRCNPVRGDYQAYLTCFDKQAHQMRLTETALADIEALLNSGSLAHGHVYQDEDDTTYLFQNTPENIANFIGSRPYVDQIIVTDADDWPLLSTYGWFIDRCPDSELLDAIKKVLIPIQIGEAEAQPPFSPTMDEIYEYRAQKDMQQGQGQGPEMGGIS